MANVKKEKGILLLDKQKLDCAVFPFQTVISLPFPQTVIRNMDVIDANALAALVHDFLLKNKLPLSSFYLVLHENLLFEKLFPSTKQGTEKPSQAVGAGTTDAKAIAPEQSASDKPTDSKIPAVPAPKTDVTSPLPYVSSQNLKEKTAKISQQQLREAEEVETQRFIDSVPFDEVSVKRTKSQAGTIVIATNKMLLSTIKDALDRDGNTVEGVYPVTLLGKEINLANGLTPDTARLLLPKVESGRAHNMLIEEKKVVEDAQGPVALGMPQKDTEKKRLFAMAGVFGLLVIVLIVLFVRMNAENAELEKKAKDKAAARADAAQTIIPTPTSVTDPIIASEAAVLADDIAVQVTFSSKSITTATALRQILQQNGYTNITTQQANINAPVSLVVFSQDIPNNMRTEFLQSISTLLVQPRVQVANDVTRSILITL
jgi:hypothetical protein